MLCLVEDKSILSHPQTPLVDPGEAGAPTLASEWLRTHGCTQTALSAVARGRRWRSDRGATVSLGQGPPKQQCVTLTFWLLLGRCPVSCLSVLNMFVVALST